MYFDIFSKYQKVSYLAEGGVFYCYVVDVHVTCEGIGAIQSIPLDVHHDDGIDVSNACHGNSTSEGALPIPCGCGSGKAISCSYGVRTVHCSCRIRYN